MLCEELQPQERRLAKILDFFGIAWKQVGLNELWQDSGGKDAYAVFASMGLLGRTLQKRSDLMSAPLLQGASSAYLYGGNNSAEASHFVHSVTRCPSARLLAIEDDERPLVIHNQSEDCGPMSGLTVPSAGSTHVLQIPQPAGEFETLISKGEHQVFCKVIGHGVPLYLDPCPEMIDIDKPVQKAFFDVGDCFTSAVPIVMYLRSAFQESAWCAREHAACVIVDDPVLRPSYGFFDFHQVARLGRETGFTCSIAFIPWNWRRSRPQVVELIKRGDTLSLCMHGSDHTGGEFASSSTARLSRQAKSGLHRMELHEASTGLKHARVMVFPQGLFSARAPGVLKHCGFLAAINTEISPVDPDVRTEVREVWQTAITKYDGFPIYTRRYAFHGFHNFAFDLLLGKPCLIATHHDDFRDNGRELIGLVRQLNALPCPPHWRAVGDVIGRAYAQRTREDGSLEVKMFGSQMVLENSESAPRRVIVAKVNHDRAQVERVEVEGRAIPFVSEAGSIGFSLDIPSSRAVTVAVYFRDALATAGAEPGVWEQFSVSTRRYLSELRDEALVRAPRAVALAIKARGLLLHRAYPKYQ